MIFISSQSQTPSGYIRGFEFVPLSHPLARTHARRSSDCIESSYSQTHDGSPHSASERAVQCPSLQQNKRATSVAAPIKLRRSVITTIRFRWLPLISFHKLIFIFSIPPHGSGAFPGASVVSSFLSSSLRPLFVRLVNARSWFYFPFAGPPAIPMVGAPGNTPEPTHTMNSGDFYETYLPRLTGQILYRKTTKH